MLGQRLGFFNDFGDVQQRLGRDATHVQADATQGGVTLDDNGIQTQVSRTEGSGITGRASTQYYDLGFDFFTHHDLFVVLISPDSAVLNQNEAAAAVKKTGQVYNPVNEMRSKKGRLWARPLTYRTSRRMSDSTPFMVVMKRAPSAPSMTRWS